MTTVWLVVMVAASTAMITRRGGRFLIFYFLIELYNWRSFQWFIQFELFFRFFHQLEFCFNRLNCCFTTAGKLQISIKILFIRYLFIRFVYYLIKLYLIFLSSFFAPAKAGISIFGFGLSMSN